MASGAFAHVVASAGSDLCNPQRRVKHRRQPFRPGALLAVRFDQIVSDLDQDMGHALLHAMADRGATRGLAGLCLGGGNAVTMAVERMN